MVSLWPWKRDDSSPASFEKALSKLSEQISQSSLRLDASRSRARRSKALWTLYTTVAYLVYTLVIALVLGVRQWDVIHYGGVIGAPIVIYGVRKAMTRFYDWRISSEEAYLEDLQKQRESTIEKLKAATKYNSTQQLLDKYGGSSAKSTPSGKGQSGTPKKKPASPSGSKQQGPPPGRTGIAPPPTANIPSRSPTIQQPSTPLRESVQSSSPNQKFQPDEPGFAPNAFSGPIQSHPGAPAQYQAQIPHWYDRLMDVLLGEDETLLKNRLALLCSQCRLVNGQAPPGVKTLDDVGKWRCGGCGALNGEESEAKKVLQTMKAKAEQDKKEGWEVVSRGDDDGHQDEKAEERRSPRDAGHDESSDAGSIREHEEEASDADNKDSGEEDVHAEASRSSSKRVTRSRAKKSA